MNPTEDDITVTARRTESLDAASIALLVNSLTHKLFGRVNVVHLIEKANLGITIVNEANEIVGHAVFYDYPSHKVIENSHWLEWLSGNYNMMNCSSLNTLFLHYYVTKDGFGKGIMKEILKTVFHAVPYLQYVFLLKPCEVETDEILNGFFDEIKSPNDSVKEYDLLVSQRHSHCPMLHIREARIEDHDDLMPIFNQNNEHLTRIYGDFFLAELIEAQDENNKCLVADVDGVAVGFISLTTNVDAALLKEHFNLDVFNNCVKVIERTKAVKRAVTPDRSLLQDEDVQSGVDRKSPIKSHASNSRKGSPLKPTSRKSKLSSSHLESRSSTKNTKEEEFEYIKETLRIDSVFSIQLFCIDERYESRSMDFLPAMFEMFEMRDFAVITVPPNVVEFPLLQHFQRISPKTSSTFSQELYLFNKNGMYTNFHVRKCVLGDTDKIKELTKDIIGHESIMDDLNKYNYYRRDKDGVLVHAYVAEVNNCIVGVCIFRHEKDINFIRSHYNIEDYIYFQLYESSEHAHLHHFVLNPIFQHYSKYFIKEIFYQSQISSLYYPIYLDFKQPSDVKPHSLVTCLNDLVAVSARRQIKYPLSQQSENAPVDEVLVEKEAYALYHINRKLTLEPKVTVNSRIVVVGASDVGLSFLETLVFCPHLCFNNLTLVSMEDVLNCNTTCDDENVFSKMRTELSRKEMGLLGLSTWVNVVQGKVSKIDRKEKYLTIDNTGKLPYDQLILCTGQQYHIANPTGVDVDSLITTSEALSAQRSKVYHGTQYDSLFEQHDLEYPERIIHWIKNSHSSAKVIVYGETIEAYTCINGLIKSGIDPKLIFHVRPPCTESSCFTDLHVLIVMEKELKTLGINISSGYTLAQYHTENEKLTSASFTSDAKPLTLECEAFFCLHKKTVDFAAFKAINDCFLVFDGKLVIDAQYRTNDHSIRAAGSLTKYARRYHRDDWSHEHCNSREVGEKLANTLLYLFDPTLTESLTENHDSEGDVLPKYEKPITVYTRLPGDYYMLQIFKLSTHTLFNNENNQGIDLVTGSAMQTDKPDYFRIHLNHYNTIDEIVCLSKKEMSVKNYECLYGLHERYLNNLSQRYNEGLINDFYSFFDEAWCLAIYHDRFKDFRSEVRDILATCNDDNTTSILERVRQIVIEDGQLTEEQRQHLTDVFVGTQTKRRLEERLSSFLDYNKYHLPMYARPAMV